MSIFRFKRFCVANERSSMKVNTDGVILGAKAAIHTSDTRILDVGTGTGTIALMLAQRLSECRLDGQFSILGIDIDEASVEEAEENFKDSPWAEHLSAKLCPLQQIDTDSCWDLIVSNPPYFDNSLQAPDERRNLARHTEVGNSLSYRELLAFADKALSPTGRLYLILPADQKDALLRCGRSFSLFPELITSISTTAKKKASRIVVGFTRERKETAEENFSIHAVSSSGYSQEYLALTHDFYLFA